MPIYQWVIWAFILILQNFAFTFVSRARNSGSLSRHLIAGFFSNGVWFVSQILIFSQLYKIMTGAYGIPLAVFTSLYYTAFTLTGSLLAHQFSLMTEKGKTAVGASAKYKQVTPAEWEALRADVAKAVAAMVEPCDYSRTKALAEQAYDLSTIGHSLKETSEFLGKLAPPNATPDVNPL